MVFVNYFADSREGARQGCERDGVSEGCNVDDGEVRLWGDVKVFEPKKILKPGWI